MPTWRVAHRDRCRKNPGAGTKGPVVGEIAKARLELTRDVVETLRFGEGVVDDELKCCRVLIDRWVL